jgi:hypothetical protein
VHERINLHFRNVRSLTNETSYGKATSSADGISNIDRFLNCNKISKFNVQGLTSRKVIVTANVNEPIDNCNKNPPDNIRKTADGKIPHEIAADVNFGE